MLSLCSALSLLPLLLSMYYDCTNMTVSLSSLYSYLTTFDFLLPLSLYLHLHHCSIPHLSGEWFEEKYHGKGTFYYNNGDEYEGDWNQGSRHGEGEHRYANGSVFTGRSLSFFTSLYLFSLLLLV